MPPDRGRVWGRSAFLDIHSSEHSKGESYMKIRSKFIIGAAVAGCVVGGLAWGTPVVNLASPLLSTGTQSADLESRGEYEPTEFRAFLKTEGPSTILEQEAAYTLTGVNGWHSHPGIVIVTLTQGSIQ